MIGEPLDPGERDPSRDLGLVPAFDEEQVAATWQRIAQARADRGRRRGPAMALAALATLGAVALALALAVVVAGGGSAGSRREPPGPLVSRDPAVILESGAVVDSPAPRPSPARALVLDDGSRVDLEARARLKVLANDGSRFMTLLDGGAAQFRVTPGGPRRWTIETALATIEVVGTVFRLDPGPTRLVVEVEHGVVVVRGDKVPNHVMRLTAGERIEITDVAAAATAAPATPAPVAVPTRVQMPPPPPSPPPSLSVAPMPAVVTGPGAEAADAGTPMVAPPAGIDAAVAAADHVRSSEPLPVDAALAEADRLRGAGRSAEAADVLERSIRADPEHLGAGLAAFTLGRLALDVLDQPDRAAAAFARVIEVDSPSGLVENAYVRRAEALIRAGRRADAAAAIDAYERAYPRGRRAASLRERLGSR